MKNVQSTSVSRDFLTVWRRGAFESLGAQQFPKKENSPQIFLRPTQGRKKNIRLIARIHKKLRGRADKHRAFLTGCQSSSSKDRPMHHEKKIEWAYYAYYYLLWVILQRLRVILSESEKAVVDIPSEVHQTIVAAAENEMIGPRKDMSRNLTC